MKMCQYDSCLSAHNSPDIMQNAVIGYLMGFLEIALIPLLSFSFFFKSAEIQIPIESVNTIVPS